MEIGVMPSINAGLNATAAVLLASGYLAIRRRRKRLHQGLMTAAFATSVLFLASYLTYHVLRKRLTGTAHVQFPDLGLLRTVYLVILTTHLTLAVPGWVSL